MGIIFPVFFVSRGYNYHGNGEGTFGVLMPCWELGAPVLIGFCGIEMGMPKQKTKTIATYVYTLLG